jgi:acyl carrier protein
MSSTSLPVGCLLPREEVQQRVEQVVRSIKSAPKIIAPNSYFVADLGFDSLIVRDVISRLSEEFCVDVPSASADRFVSVGAAVDFFAAHPKAR